MLNFFKNYWFTVYLSTTVFIVALMIVQHNQNIDRFKKSSVDHMLTLEAENVNDIQKKLENLTHQPVLIESIGKNKYKIFLRCPPEKYDQISGWVKKSDK